jgi:hypothetical protein
MINLKIKTPMKFTKTLLTLATAFVMIGVTTASAQFSSYNSFVNGFNLQLVSTTGAATNIIMFGTTNVDTAFGVNNYVYPGSYPASANNSYIGSNTVVTGSSAFGYQTNTGVILDARLWPNNNSDVASDLGVFISICGVNNTVANTYVLTFAPVVDVQIPVGSGTITNSVVSTSAQNQFTVSLTANGLTNVNVLTNPPNAVIAGAHKLRLLSVAMTTTNAVGYSTNYSYTSTLTNGVWQAVTNSTIQTNWGGVYINAGVSGYPPFHSP